jgi:hypothetical protein
VMVTQGSGSGATVTVGSGVGATVTVGSGAGATVTVGSGAGATVTVGSGAGGTVTVGSVTVVRVTLGSGTSGSNGAGAVTPRISDVGGIDEGTAAKSVAGPAAVVGVEPGPTGGLTDTEFVVDIAKSDVDAGELAGAGSVAGRALTPRR